MRPIGFSPEQFDQVDFVRPDGTRVRADRLTAGDTARLTAAAKGKAVDYEKGFLCLDRRATRVLPAAELSAIDAANPAEEIESLGCPKPRFPPNVRLP